jgi:uncharacterized protein Yka (UPF0111/DUF47 family)
MSLWDWLFRRRQRPAREFAEPLKLRGLHRQPEEALQAADAVEREEENVDDIHEKARALLGTEDLPRAGVAILASQLFEALEMVADWCEDACDEVRVIMVRETRTVK